MIGQKAIRNEVANLSNEHHHAWIVLEALEACSHCGCVRIRRTEPMTKGCDHKYYKYGITLQDQRAWKCNKCGAMYLAPKDAAPPI